MGPPDRSWSVEALTALLRRLPRTSEPRDLQMTSTAPLSRARHSWAGRGSPVSSTTGTLKPSRCNLPNSSMLEIFARSQWRTMTSASRAASGAPGSEATVWTAKPCLDSSTVRNPRSITPSSMRRTRMAFGSLAEAKRGRRCLQGHDILFKSGHLKLLPLGSVLESETGRESTPRRPASRQSSAVTSDDADRARAVQLPCWRTRPRAERVTYRNVDHPSLPYRPGCLPSGTPAVRASKALPMARKLAERRHRARDQI